MDSSRTHSLHTWRKQHWQQSLRPELKKIQDLPYYNGAWWSAQSRHYRYVTCQLQHSYNSFHNDTYLVPLGPDDLLQAVAKIHYNRERRAYQRNMEALHSSKLKSVCLDCYSTAAKHSAAVHRHDPIHQTTHDRFVLPVFCSNENCVRNGRMKVPQKLRSCCHEDREDSASSFFCFRCCNSPVHCQIFKSNRTKKRIFFSL